METRATRTRRPRKPKPKRKPEPRAKPKPKPKPKSEKVEEMEMNFPRALAIIKSLCPNKWARAHAKSIPITRDAHGLRGVYVQVCYILEHTVGWDDYGARAFLQEWAEKHKKEVGLGA